MAFAGFSDSLTPAGREINITTVTTAAILVKTLEKDEAMTLKMSLQEAKERALELMHRGYH
ncbi:MAG: hypothetical protein FJ023_00815 [Chloroflexi bacterium]|nr:hypothetical protein [Chloroflexota bacterium]